LFEFYFLAQICSLACVLAYLCLAIIGITAFLGTDTPALIAGHGYLLRQNGLVYLRLSIIGIAAYTGPRLRLRRFKQSEI
jgi:hypothetical protein